MALNKPIALYNTSNTTNNPARKHEDLAQSESTKDFINNALSRLLDLAKSTSDERDMEALGLILFYLDSLENDPTSTESKPESNEVYLETPITLTL